MNLHKFQHSL